ncbi:MAG: hypothetical protein NTV94_08590 [Planctomycetota bacterium]|nr:hypothetical protein [Planctomycetota bacterium]
MPLPDSSPPTPGPTPTAITNLAGWVNNARSIVVLTGAGISAESGIRTFRDTMEGLWKEFDPAKLATPEAFEADPAMVTRWYDHRRISAGTLHHTPRWRVPALHAKRRPPPPTRRQPERCRTARLHHRVALH